MLCDPFAHRWVGKQIEEALDLGRRRCSRALILRRRKLRESSTSQEDETYDPG